MPKLFYIGSHARGQANKDSDWDILILLDKQNVTLSTEQKYRHYLLDVEMEIGQPISVFVRSKRVWEKKYRVTPFYQNIKTEGVEGIHEVNDLIDYIEYRLSRADGIL